MTVLDVPVRVPPGGGRPPPPARLGRRAPLLDPAWPMLLMTVWMPVAYFLGLAAAVWIVPAIAFGVPLAMRRSVRLPGMIFPFVCLALWIPLTALQLDSFNALPVFLYRWLLWVAAVASFLWLCNTPTGKVSTKRVVDMLAALWIVLVFFGYLAIVLPHFEVPGLFQRVLPAGLRSNPFIYDLTVVRFAELQNFGLTAVPRPAAPMPYTNGWGSTLGLLTPFFVVSWLTAPSFNRRVVGWILAALAVAPIAVSTNRGMWLSIAVALVYFAIRRAIRGDGRPLIAVGMVGVAALTIVVFTPFVDNAVNARLENTERSNETRGSVYKLAFEGAKESPMLGYGAPASKEQPPAIGTHGMIWYVMFSHGFPAAAFLLVGLGTLFVATMIPRTETALWAHISILVCITQITYYGLLPQIVVVGIAAGICWRENNPKLAAREPA